MKQHEFQNVKLYWLWDHSRQQRVIIWAEVLGKSSFQPLKSS